MKIYKFSNILCIPFFIALIYFIYRLVKDTHDLTASWAIVPLACLVLIYLFQPQIDYWWLSRAPVEIETEILALIEKTNPFYKRLNAKDKEEFHKRLVLYINGRAFVAKGMEKDNEVPYDIKCMIAQIPVTLGFNSGHFLMGDYERIIIYKHAFPTPLKRYLHTYEVNHEDGVIIFSMEHAEAAFFQTQSFYNVAWQAFSEAYLSFKKKKPGLPGNDLTWNKLKEITGFDKGFIQKTAGFEDVDHEAFAITAYYLNRENFKKMWPEMFKQIDDFQARA